MIINWFILAILLAGVITTSSTLFSQNLSDSEKERKAVVEKMDKKGLRFQTKAVIENSKEMLIIPESIKNLDGFTVAIIPPSVEFAIVPFENRYFSPVPKAYLEGTPVIQYNVATGERKVLAFLFPYFYEKYGYIAFGTFSVKLDENGEKLFVLFNGAFTEYKQKGRDVFGVPSVMLIHIPKSERT